MAGVGTQPTSLRKYLGALKDTTTVSLAKVNSDYKVENSVNPLKNVWKFSCSIAYCYMLYSAAGLACLFSKQELDIAIVKATNHVERPSKEKYIRGGISCLLAESLKQ